MTTIRIMTYSVHGCCGGDGRTDPDRVVEVIGAGAPDIVALQEVDADGGESQLSYLARRLGMSGYADPGQRVNAFLSRYPLRGVRTYDLGDQGACLRADADIRGRRVHLLNLRLATLPWRRRHQLDRLFGPELLANPSLACPTVILGDFGDWLWGLGNMHLAILLRRAAGPLWAATYPACFPVTGRDRAYLRGDIRVLDSTVARSPQARKASSHLPYTMTVQLVDTLNFLSVEQLGRNRMEIAPG